MKKTIPYILFLTIISIVITYVMPFNVILADEQTDNFGKAIVTPETPLKVGRHYGNDVYITVDSGELSVYGYYAPNGDDIGLLKYLYSDTNNFNGAYQLYINEIPYYRSSAATFSGNHDSNPYYNPDFPIYNDVNGLDVPDSGDYVYDFIGAENFLPTIKRDPHQTFLSWTVGSNPYTIDISSTSYTVGVARTQSGNKSYSVYFFVDDPNATIEITRPGGSITPTINSVTYRGRSINYFVITSWNYNPESYTYGWNTNTERGSYSTGKLHLAYNIYLNDTYEETDPFTAGDVVASFYTKFAGSGTSNENNDLWRENVDVIQWSNYDSYGQYINDYGLIEIRAVPGEFISQSQSTLIGQTFSDFVLDSSSLIGFGYFNPSDGQFTRKWSDMNNDFITDLPFFSLYNYFYDELWHKNGWIWQIRIVDKEDPETALTEWQTIYNTTSYTSNDLDTSTLNPDLVNTIQNINNTNNTTNNWYINNTTINTTNPDGTDTTTKPWWSYLLEAITSLLEKIVDVIGGIFNSTIEALAELVSNLGVNILEFFQNIIDTITTNNDAIDLTLPEFNLDSDSLDALGEFKELTNAYTDIFINSGLWFVIVVPLVIFLLRVVF